jgi:polar amino acid transport system substrate-binding protein
VRFPEYVPVPLKAALLENAPAPLAAASAISDAPKGVAPSEASNAAMIAKGREIFNNTCAHCHGPDAVQSERRVNLRLLHHRYGDKMEDTFFCTVTHGRPDKGMPNWSGIFSTSDFEKIFAFL